MSKLRARFPVARKDEESENTLSMIISLFHKKRFCLAAGGIAASFCALAQARPAAVATPTPLATEAALEVLHQGGTAADAFAAALFMLTLAEPQASGIGGGFFALYFDAARKETVALDARETSPRALSSDVLAKAPSFFPYAQGSGAAAGVPGTMAGLKSLLDRYGKLPLSKVVAPALHAAQEGYPLPKRAAEALLKDSLRSCDALGVPRLAMFSSTRALYFKPLKETQTPLLKCRSAMEYRFQPKGEGDSMRNPAFARLLRQASDEGLDIFYRGEMANSLLEVVRNPASLMDGQVIKGYDPLPGPMEENDLIHYRPRWRKPLHTFWRGKDALYSIFAMPPPSAGGVVLAQSLWLLDDPRTFSPEFPKALALPLGSGGDVAASLLSRAMSLAFADAKRAIADPDAIAQESAIVASVLDPEALARRRLLLASQEPVAKPSELAESKAPCAPGSGWEEHGTSHVTVADAEGNVISATATIESAFGNGMVVPEGGFFLNNEMTDFDTSPASCNAIAPGVAKRPRSFMTPLIVFRLPYESSLDSTTEAASASSAKFFMALGSAGGPAIPAAVLIPFLNVVRHGMEGRDALAAPRLYDFNTGEIFLEPPLFADKTLAVSLQLETKKKVLSMDLPTGTQMLLWEREELKAFADPRREGTVGYVWDK